METKGIKIDEDQLRKIIQRKKFKISTYDYFIYVFVSFMLVIFSGLLIYSIATSGKKFYFIISIILLIFIVLSFLLRLVILYFKNTFFFKLLPTGLTKSECTIKVIELLNLQNLPFQISSNKENVIICMQYFQFSKSILETTIITLDQYLLINTRNRNTSIISINGTKIINYLQEYFKSKDLIKNKV